jgi:MFS family permease
MVVTGFATIIVGRLALTVRRQQWLAVIGFGTYAMVTFGYIFVHTPAQLMFVQALLGVAQALATPTWYALYAHVGSKASGESWGDMQGQSSIVMGLAFIGGGLVAAHVSFQVLFALMGSVQVLATVLMVGVLRSDVDATPEEEATPAEEEDAHLEVEFA